MDTGPLRKNRSNNTSRKLKAHVFSSFFLQVVTARTRTLSFEQIC